MNKKQIQTKKKQISLMDKSTLDYFAVSVHAAVGLKQETKDELLHAIDARFNELMNSFSLEVEMGEVKTGEFM